MFFWSLFKPLFYIVAFFILSGCTTLAISPLMMGAGATELMVGSVATEVTTGKSPSEHVLSESIGKDCKFTRIFKGKNICEYRLKSSEIPVVDLTRKVRIVD
jgi:hypothetical protein